MPAQVKVTLSEDDKKRLINNTRRRTTPIRLVERSKIVLLASQGQPNYKIAQELGIDINKVGRSARQPQRCQKRCRFESRATRLGRAEKK